MTTSTKSYTAKSSAIRAAKKDFTTEYDAGLVTVSQNADGKWVYQVEAAEQAAREYSPEAQEMHDAINAKKAKKAAKVANRDNKEVDSQPSAETIANDPARAHAEALGIDGLENLAKDAKLGNISHVSEIERPCDRVWAIAEAMQGERRKDIIAACVDQGVAYYTARTQYQHWFTAQKNDKAAAERAAAKKAAK